jgi:hypothetical protein
MRRFRQAACVSAVLSSSVRFCDNFVQHGEDGIFANLLSSLQQ